MPDTLKTQLVRLGSSNPELRKHIKPVLDKLNQGKLASTSFAKAAKDLYDLAFKSYRDPHVQDVMSGMETSIMRGLRTGNEVWVREEIHELKKMFPSGENSNFWVRKVQSYLDGGALQDLFDASDRADLGFHLRNAALLSDGAPAFKAAGITDKEVPGLSKILKALALKPR